MCRPLYFCFNTLGPAKLEGKVNDHYRPWSAFLEPHRESDCECLADLTALLLSTDAINHNFVSLESLSQTSGL